MSKKLGQVAGIFLFFLIVSVPPVAGLFIFNDIQTMERRKATKWPNSPRSFAELMTWPRKIDAFVNDHIGFRDEAVLANGLLHWKAGSPYGPVVLGSDGNLFRTNFNILELYRGKYRFPRRAILDKRLEEFYKLRNELTAKRVDFYMTLVPNKITLFGENALPKWLNKKVHAPVLLDQYELELSDRLGRNFIPMREVLKSNIGMDLYSKYGTHWNELGALIAFGKIVEHISDRHEVGPVNIRDFKIVYSETIEDTGNARAAGLSGYLKNYLPKLKPKSDTIILKQSKQGILATRGTERKTYHFVNNEPPNNLKVLFIGDSFALRWHNTVPTYFNETVFMHHNLGRIDMKTLTEFNPDIVVFQMVEQQLSRFFRFRPG